MNKKMTSFVACCLIGFGAQVAGYIYLDQVLFAPLSAEDYDCLLYTSPSPRDRQKSRMPSSA